MNGYCSLMLIYSRKGRKWLISSFKIMKMNHSLWLKQVIISINTAWNLNFYLLWCGKNLFVFKSEKQIKILQGKSQNGKCTGSFIVYFCYNWGLKLAYKTKCQLFYSCLIHPFTNTLIQQHFLYLSAFYLTFILQWMQWEQLRVQYLAQRYLSILKQAGIEPLTFRLVADLL